MSYFIGPIPRISALPPFEQVAQDAFLLSNQSLLRPGDNPHIDGQIDGFSCCCGSGYGCSPDDMRACPACLMGMPCQG